MQNELDIRDFKKRKFVSSILDSLSSFFPIEELIYYRGLNFRITNIYQVRIKSSSKHNINNFIEEIKSHICSLEPSIANISLNNKSCHSTKYQSISFMHNNIDFEFVLAKGKNRGEEFEKMLVDGFISVIDNKSLIDDDRFKYVKDSISALNSVNQHFHLENIVAVHKRSGKTSRSHIIVPSDAGKIIADLHLELSCGTYHPISVKNKDGTNIASFGISSAFTNDLKVNTESKEFQVWIKPFGLDLAAIEQGLIDYRDKTDINIVYEVNINNSIPEDSNILECIKIMFGSNYFYLRETRDGFNAEHITDDYLSKILTNLQLVKIRYPSKHRKQTTIFLSSDLIDLKIEIRSSSKRIKPNTIKLQLSNYK